MTSADVRAPLLAVDIGGTKTLVAMVSRRGNVLARYSTPTRADDGPEATIQSLRAATRRIVRSLSGAAPAALAIAAAGAIDTGRGLVTASPNLPRWKDVPLRETAQREIGLPTYLINDATAAAYGEHRAGAGARARNMVFVTVSTGIGGGIIADGRLYQGASGAAGEIGHMVIDAGGPRCGCGNYGCLEALAPGTAIAREARDRVALGAPSSLARLDTAKVTAEAVAHAARDGDALAADVVARAAFYLGTGLCNLVNIFNPEVIVIGGGVSRTGDLLLEPARRVVREHAIRLSAEAVRIVPALLGADAGVIGAALFAFSKMAARK